MKNLRLLFLLFLIAFLAIPVSAISVNSSVEDSYLTGYEIGRVITSVALHIGFLWFGGFVYHYFGSPVGYIKRCVMPLYSAVESCHTLWYPAVFLKSIKALMRKNRFWMYMIIALVVIFPTISIKACFFGGFLGQVFWRRSETHINEDTLTSASMLLLKYIKPETDESEFMYELSAASTFLLEKFE